MIRAPLRSPLGRARGLGSARAGVEHWWLQRISAVALVPLVLWLATSVAFLTGADYGEFVAWVASPLNAVLLLLAIAATFYHLKVGLDVVIEDYVHTAWRKTALLVLNGFAATATGAVSAFAVLKMAL